MYEDTPPNLWFEEVPNDQTATDPPADDLLIKLKDEAKIQLDTDTKAFNTKNSKKNSNFQWMKTMISQGTVSDKIAAYIVSIQDSPVHNLELLSNLVSLVKVGKKKECVVVMEHLVELFLENLLPSSRKLIPFRQRPLAKLDELSSGNTATGKKYLKYWYFEDQLKEIYTLFVRSLNTVTQDTVDNNKEKAIGAMYKLLADSPEQEQNLLNHIVNKVGDPSKKVASKSIYCLTQLLHKHPNMQGVILNEVEKLLFRSNISQRAQYYALCFLSQFYLDHEFKEVARRLIEVYFSFFKACIKKGEVNSRMMSVLLMGVNRAYPYAKMELDKISDHINTMYRVVHVANFNVSLHALALLYQVSDQSNSFNDRFFNALYRKLLDPQIANSTHQAMLLSLVHKVLSKDAQVDRVKVFIKRLLQLAIYTQPSLACATLYVISHLVSKRPELSALVLKASTFSVQDEEDNEEEKYTDVKDDEEEQEVPSEENQEPVEENKKAVSGWVHCDTQKQGRKGAPIKYDGLVRNPLYAGGQFCAYTELNILKEHSHPTVSLYANNLLNGQTIQYSGDPLKDFSLIRFLDRFAFKNPKRPEEVVKVGCHPTFGKRKKYAPRGTRSVAVNSRSYLNEQQQNIPVEELYLYTYLKKRYRQQKIQQAEEEEEESDLESVASEEFEEMLNNMTKSKGDVDEEDEVDELDYMDAFSEGLKSNSSNKKNKTKSRDNSEDATNEDEQLSDMEMGSDDEDDDMSDIVFDSAEEQEEEEEEEAIPKKKKSKKDDAAALFASADDFAALLEEEGSSKVAPGSSNAWANKDNANLRQISWEEKRNHWLKGYNNTKKTGQKRFNKNTKRKGNDKSNFRHKMKGK